MPVCMKAGFNKTVIANDTAVIFLSSCSGFSAHIQATSEEPEILIHVLRLSMLSCAVSHIIVSVISENVVTMH